MLLRIAKVFFELLVEIAEGLSPTFFAFFDFVEFFFEASGVLNIENVGKVLDQQIGYDQSDFRRIKFSSDLLHVLPLLNGAKDRGIRGRTADAALFEFLNERGFGVARWRHGEMLLGIQRL